MSDQTNQKSRREFIANATALGLLGSVGSMSLLTSCNNKTSAIAAPQFYDSAPDGPLLRAGLVGCGGRGTGAALNFLNAGPNLEITAVGDVFERQVEQCRQRLKEQKGIEIADDKCFTGFDAFKKVIDSGVDVVLLVTPQHFRPEHLDYAVRAKKHVFMEKPGGVDPVGIRTLMAAGRMAEAAGLTVVAGTNFSHQRDFLTTRHMVHQGAIGELLSASAYDIRGRIWHTNRQPEWTDMEAMLWDWMNWNWLSGGDNVDIAVHQIDMVSRYFGAHPVKALGFGGRHRRLTGNVYDFYSVEYEFEDGRLFNCKTRCIDGCDNKFGFRIYGTKGSTNCQNKIWDLNNNLIWEYEYPLDNEGRPTNRVAISSYDEEHINFVTAIRTNKPLNEAQLLAEATLCGVMGRESAITGKIVTWDDMMSSDLRLGPTEYAMGPVSGFDPLPPVPGTAQDITKAR
jgi:predicted dehydrogenase